MFKNYPNRKLIRMRGFDYSKNGFYFVTICIKNRINYFGQIKDGKMILNKYGRIVEKCWLDLPYHYLNCKLDEFIIMPNHVHGIIEIDNNFARIKNINAEGSEGSEGAEGAGFKTARTNPARTNPARAKLYSLCEIIRGFKSFSSRRINEINGDDLFRWQRSFYDHIIRKNNSIFFIRKYIKDNPKNWNSDRNNIIIK